MSGVPDQVLQALRSASDPMRTSEIRDAIGLEGAEGTTKVSGALNGLVSRGAVERIQSERGYTYLAVPGWTPPKRGGGVPAVKGNTRAARAEKRQAKAAKAAKPKEAAKRARAEASAVREVNRDIERARALLATTATAAIGADPAPEAALTAEARGAVQLPRDTVRTLVAGVLMFGGELGEALRRAVIEATEAAA